MKNILTLIFCFLLFGAFAQTGTTLDEYRYLSKGYAYQLEMGLDPAKEGYEIRHNYLAANGVLVVGLYKNGHQHPQGLVFVAPTTDSKTYVMAIPNPDAAPNVQQLYKQDLQMAQPKAARAKFAEAKNHYLFNMPVSTAPMAYNGPPQRVVPSVRKESEAKNEFTSKGVAIAPKPVTPELIGQPIAKGAVAVSGQLNIANGTRQVLVRPQAINDSGTSGKVMIKFCVNKAGKVTFAKFTQRGSTTLNRKLKAAALQATRQMQLSISGNQEECGTVGYNF